MNASSPLGRLGLTAAVAILIVWFGMNRGWFEPAFISSLLGGSGQTQDTGVSSAVRNGLFIAGMMIAFVLLRRLASWIMGGGNLSWIEPNDLAQQLGKGFKAAIVDVRTPAEFTGDLGHIKGSVNIPLDRIGQDLPKLKQMSEGGIIAVCRSDSRAAMAASRLKKAGIDNVTVLKGGMMRWNALGLRSQR